MSAEYRQTRQFREASFHECDLNGATFRDCDLRNVRITSSWVDELRVSGFDGRAGTVVVDDVVVTEFVAAELDRRHPERVLLRAVRTAEDVRAAWATLEQLWSETVVRAEGLPEEMRHERVDGEWSVTETVRHLVFAVDSWVGSFLLAGAAPYHRLGLPPTDFSDEARAQMRLDPEATPSWADVVAAHAERRDQVRQYLATLTDEALTDVRTGTLVPGEEEESFSVAHCVSVVLNEHCEHRRYAVRDLAVLEARRTATLPSP